MNRVRLTCQRNTSGHKVTEASPCKWPRFSSRCSLQKSNRSLQFIAPWPCRTYSTLLYLQPLSATNTPSPKLCENPLGGQEVREQLESDSDSNGLPGRAEETGVGDMTQKEGLASASVSLLFCCAGADSRLDTLNQALHL